MASPRGRQAGVALITALLVTAIAAIVAANMAARQRLEIHRSSNLLASDQAWLFALGVEDWASQILSRDARNGHTDHLGEDWAIALPPIAVEGGATVSGHIEDLQGRLNLNDLIRDGRPDAVTVGRLRRLLRHLDADEGLADAVLDWIDGDETPRLPAGAEDTAYLIHDPAYRTANRPLASPSELRLVNGFSPDLVEALSPFVQTLPERTPINVNTAPAAILMTLSEDLTEADADQIVEERADHGFSRLEDFRALPMIKRLQTPIEDITVESHYFLLTAEVSLDAARLRLTSILHRDGDGRVRTLLRSLGGY